MQQKHKKEWRKDESSAWDVACVSLLLAGLYVSLCVCVSTHWHEWRCCSLSRSWLEDYSTVLYYYTHKANPQPQVLAGNLLILASAICLNPPTSNHSLVPKKQGVAGISRSQWFHQWFPGTKKGFRLQWLIPCDARCILVLRFPQDKDKTVFFENCGPLRIIVLRVRRIFYFQETEKHSRGLQGTVLWRRKFVLWGFPVLQNNSKTWDQN